MKIGVVVALGIGLFFVNPMVKMPFTSQFIDGGGPIIPGPWWPYVFITIACGAISGFHALIGSGTTPKLIEKETQIPMVGYGAMLTEGFVALMALLAAVTSGSQRLLRHQHLGGCFREAQHARRRPARAQQARRSRCHQSSRRRHLACRRYGPRLRQHRRGAAVHDEVLVPVHHHVRGPLHPHDDRRGNPSGPLPPPGPPGLHLGAHQEDRLDARRHRDERRRLLRLGIHALHGGYLLDLAHVRCDEPDTGRAGPGHRDDDHPPDLRRRRSTPWSRWFPAPSCPSRPSWRAS